MDRKIIKSTIELFKAMPVENKKKQKPSKELLEKTLKLGFVFSPEVLGNYNEKELSEIIKIIKTELSISAEQMNNTFHKSWNKIKTASIEQLVYEQLIHYFTTYGFEQLGIYNENSVYVPNEKLEIPNLNENINITIIKGYTKKELKDKILNMLQSGIALKDDTMKNILDIVSVVDFNEQDIESIKNKEIKIMLYDYMSLLPQNPTEFLRYVIYKLTEKTLLIKNKDTINAIKEKADVLNVNGFFIKYKKDSGFEQLASIFYRYKPLFLAMKSNAQMNAIINKIRKLADKNHKPMNEDFLNNITAKIKKGEKIDVKILNKNLDDVNIFRKIRVAYALNFRTHDVDSILYRVRNGKGYAKEFSFINKTEAKRVMDIILNSITEDISKNVKGKKIYIPENINYTLPATEKQFSGNIPAGSSVAVDKDMVFGVHWTDIGHNRIDIDLSLINATVGKIGWDSSYRDAERSILFSGDRTSAPLPDGASELYYIQRQKAESFIMIANYFNFEDKYGEVPLKVIVGKEQVSNMSKNYTINPNNVVAVNNTKINTKQLVLGLITTTTKECRFYFTETSVGNAITSSDNEYTNQARKYLFDGWAIGLKDILVKAGAKLMKTNSKCDIDLSLESLEKDTIMKLLIK